MLRATVQEEIQIAEWHTIQYMSRVLTGSPQNDSDEEQQSGMVAHSYPSDLTHPLVEKEVGCLLLHMSKRDGR